MYAQVTLINHLLTFSLTSSSSEIIRVSTYLDGVKNNSVHVHECSTFWVGIFIILKKKLPCLLFDVDMRILIGKIL